jgi:hypothetical protein
MVPASHTPVNHVMTKSLNKLLHMDTIGMAWVHSIGGKSYVIVVDDFLWYSWVFFMESKDGAFLYPQDLILRLQNEFPKHAMRAIHSDNSTEFNK